jgi:hypothetical protein
LPRTGSENAVTAGPANNCWKTQRNNNVRLVSESPAFSGAT